jgi:hypothetical protein
MRFIALFDTQSVTRLDNGSITNSHTLQLTLKASSLPVTASIGGLLLPLGPRTVPVPQLAASNSNGSHLKPPQTAMFSPVFW